MNTWKCSKCSKEIEPSDVQAIAIRSHEKSHQSSGQAKYSRSSERRSIAGTIEDAAGAAIDFIKGVFD